MLKTADQIIGPALDEFYERRPTAFKHLNLRDGVYWHPFAAHRAQAARALQYLAELVSNNRLAASGQALRDYVASEYVEVPVTGATFAQGELSLSRPTGVSSGDIPKGARYLRRANPTTQIPFESAEYETLADVHFDVGQLTAGPVPLQAISEGPRANHTIRTDSVPHGVVYVGASLFDTTITVSAFSAAGGSAGAEDPYVRRYAKAYSKGQYGPTADASKYGALSFGGIRNHLVFDQSAQGIERILVADGSWASSERLSKAVQQSMYDSGLVGVGCRVSVGTIRNKVVSIDATVILRDWNYASDTLAIDNAIREACRTYLDDRPDWNVVKTRALRNAITRAHPKILKCSAATVKDVTGATVPEITSPNYDLEQFHYYLASKAVTITYTGPS